MFETQEGELAQLRTAQSLLRPFVLRRLEDEVDTRLPFKVSMAAGVVMSGIDWVACCELRCKTAGDCMLLSGLCTDCTHLLQLAC